MHKFLYQTSKVKQHYFHEFFKLNTQLNTGVQFHVLIYCVFQEALQASLEMDVYKKEPDRESSIKSAWNYFNQVEVLLSDTKPQHNLSAHREPTHVQPESSSAFHCTARRRDIFRGDAVAFSFDLWHQLILLAAAAVAD